MVETAETVASMQEAGDISEAFADERPRLVRLCLALTGDASAAEDLAQETLLVAWRERAHLRAPSEAGPWLAGIARNLCRRYLRARGREHAHLLVHRPNDGTELVGLPEPLDTVASDDDLALDLEQAELATLLDRALALLPEESRALLVASYLHETPLPALARNLGLAEGTLRVRLHRGRLALRQVLTTTLREDVAAYGAALPVNDGWHDSRIYCPFCGQYYLRYRIDRATGDFSIVCAGGCAGTAVVGQSCDPELVATVRSPKALLTRHCLFLAERYRRILASGDVVRECGHPVSFHHWTPEILAANDVAGMSDATPFGIFAQCPICGEQDSASAWHLALDTTVAQQFWKRHPRMRALPMRLIEAEGRAVIATGFESATSEARLEILSDAETYAVLRVVTT